MKKDIMKHKPMSTPNSVAITNVFSFDVKGGFQIQYFR